MISETQIRYGSAVSRHSIFRAAVRNQRRREAEMRAKRESSAAGRGAARARPDRPLRRLAPYSSSRSELNTS